MRATGWWRRSKVASSDRPAHRKVLVLGSVLLVLMGVLGAVGLWSVHSIRGDLGVVVEDDGRVLTELQAIHRLVQEGQLSLEQAATATTEDRSRLLADFDRSFEEVVSRWDASTADPDGPSATTDRVLFDEWAASASAFRQQLSQGISAADLAQVRASFEQVTAGFEADITPLAQTVEARGNDALDGADLARTVLLVVAGLGLVIGVIVCRSTYKAAAAQHDEILRRDGERAREAARTSVESRVAAAFEFARIDTDAFEAADLALRELVPSRPTELLLADSSRAHVELAFRTRPDEGLPGCGVPTPSDCPAVARGQTLVFDTSERFDVCPFLRDRPPSPISAICIPVSVSGTAEGVLHSTAAPGTPVDDLTRHILDVVAVRIGDRVGVLRAFSRSETQAATDPLTGLANRRSFENRVGAMLRTGTNVAIAFGDLDHFKQLNDTHGHDAGDRALRTFARTFRHAVRPGDVIARWGGEEFVAAFPATNAEDVGDVIQRLQDELVTVVANGAVPPFTVSFGVADQRDGDDLETLVAAADRALLDAKRAGRDRVVLASAARVRRAPTN